MARKVKSFADKMKKSGIDIYKRCETCGQYLAPHKVITPEFNEGKNNYKFPTKTVLICKCNEKDFFAN